MHPQAQRAPVLCEVSADPIAPEHYLGWLSEPAGQSGAVVSFSGLVREMNEGQGVTSLELEHYPGMTEKYLLGIAGKTLAHWSLNKVAVVHRVGLMQPGDMIVFVGAASAHRRDAFQACECVMDLLKTRAPFWKKESGPQGARWVAARATDAVSAQRWDIPWPYET